MDFFLIRHLTNFILCLGFIASTRLISILLTLKQLKFNNNLICNSNHKRYKNIYYWYGIAIVWKFKKNHTLYTNQKKANEFKTCLRSNSLHDDLLSLPISHFSQVFICFNDVRTCNKQNTNYKRKDVSYIFLCKISAPPPTCDHTLLNYRIISWMVRILTSYMILYIVSGYYMYVIRGRNVAFSNVQKRESRLIVCFQFKSNKQNVAGRDFFFISIFPFFFLEIIPVREISQIYNFNREKGVYKRWR